MKLHRYPGQDFTITYDVKRCIHAEECVRHSPKVFDPRAKPWIDPSRASAAEAVATVHHCPTGALHVEVADTALAERPDAVNSVTVSAAGPLYLRGDLRIVTKEGEVTLADMRMALCRCGASANKPLCDNAHLAEGFVDPGEPEPQESAGATPGSGPLNIHPIANGPLHLTGPLVVKDAFGDAVFVGEETWLCRCGHSSDKPFCDGTHKKVGFKG